ncbi:MAG: hypothetical protein Q8R37_05560, partial [Nanoarchaeota archaeon]|nr:hypothetical protein [Nanoarchaeota archaeon]
MLDVELLARKQVMGGDKGVNGCVLASFTYRTRAELKVVQEGYQRGPVHIGKFELNLRVYGWTDQEVENYKKLKEKEILLFMGDISSTVQSAMESLGKELDVYLEEARKGVNTLPEMEKKEEKMEQKSLGEKLFADFYTPKAKKEKTVSAKELRMQEEAQKVALGKLLDTARSAAWNTYDKFKKAHGMITW